MRRALFILTIALFALPAARGDGEDSTSFHSPDGQYQLVLPKPWVSADFHVDAVQIGAINKHTGEYVEVIAENIQDYTDSLVQYADAKRDMMALSLDNPHLTPGQSLTVNGVPAILYEIHGQLPGTDVSVGYILTILKTKTHYIQIIGWTKESRFAANQPDLEQLPAKFSETGAGQNN
jgi:hypothetical protein